MNHSRKPGMFSADKLSSELTLTRSSPLGGIFSDCHSFHIVNGIGGKPLEWTLDQRAFLLSIRREVKFKERVIAVIVAEEEPGVGERNHSRGVINTIAIHFSKEDGRNCL